jgi:hypothetical protein
MCTVSWLAERGGFTIFFNRDELKTRSRALPPYVRSSHGMNIIAPLDPDGKGTWIGANQLGLACCLLNDYSSCRMGVLARPEVAKGRDAHPTSRGLIVESLLGTESQRASLVRLRNLELADFRPFSILLFQSDTHPVLCRWNGSTLIESFPSLPFSSSSFDTARVLNARLKSFPARCNARTLEAFHASHAPSRSAYSVCMHRADAETMSFSRIRVTRETIDFAYLPAAPCRKNEFQMLQQRMER